MKHQHTQQCQPAITKLHKELNMHKMYGVSPPPTLQLATKQVGAAQPYKFHLANFFLF